MGFNFGNDQSNRTSIIPAKKEVIEANDLYNEIME